MLLRLPGGWSHGGNCPEGEGSIVRLARGGCGMLLRLPGGWSHGDNCRERESSFNVGSRIARAQPTVAHTCRSEEVLGGTIRQPHGHDERGLCFRGSVEGAGKPVFFRPLRVTVRCESIKQCVNRISLRCRGGWWHPGDSAMLTTLDTSGRVRQDDRVTSAGESRKHDLRVGPAQEMPGRPEREYQVGQ